MGLQLGLDQIKKGSRDSLDIFLSMRQEFLLINIIVCDISCRYLYKMTMKVYINKWRGRAVSTKHDVITARPILLTYIIN
jgi:hypothetical protein